ncbi:toxin [Alteromonas sp. KUL49]|uniref:ImmA/IrrE family metallo-endopeptidase n=1 Tax=Alteromonas sp. KUL49 TaxID=2480798 RepID=UPI00102EE3C8|nr:toxin [Alteromonas sp. KUL49]TAP38736.1 toxin [Alteromonas sp. KUL49]GEA12691.1 hypothetical protein KUL49_30660 [Alteromonas sp. KUL49]
MSEPYQLRGNRVQPLDQKSIEFMALKVAQAFNINRRNRKRLDKSFEMLIDFSVTLNVYEDKEWNFLTRGHFDPNTMTISVPNSIYTLACQGEKEALSVMLHEMGHVFLAHRAILHHSSSAPQKEEDAEWQADEFARVILEYMGYTTKQMSFDFIA